MFKFSRLFLVATTAVAATAASSALADKATHRALVADFANGKLTLIELPSGRAIGHYGVEGAARLKASDNGRLIFIAQGKQGRVNVLDSGISVEAHGDHFDTSVKQPRLLERQFLGGKPSHINSAFGMSAVFFDETGTADAVEDKALLEGKSRSQPLKADMPHHGLAAPLNGHFAISVTQQMDGRPVAHGMEVMKRGGGTIARSTDCPRLHGEARLSGVSAYGCTDGVLFLSEDKGKFVFSKAAYPGTLPKDRMVRNLAGSLSVRSFVGDFGADGMVIIDPATKDFLFVPLLSRRMHFARDPLFGERAFVITENGQLHRLNALTGKLEQSLPVTEAYSMEGGSAIARPRLSASGGIVVVTDPAKGKVHIIDGEKMAVVRSVDVVGAPFDVVAVGAPDHDH